MNRSSFVSRPRRNAAVGKSWAYPDVVWPSFSAEPAGRMEKPEAGSGSDSSTTTFIIGFKKRKLQKVIVPQAVPRQFFRESWTLLHFCQAYQAQLSGPGVVTTASDVRLSKADFAGPERKHKFYLFEQFIEKLVNEKIFKLIAQVEPAAPLANARSRGDAFKKVELVNPENAQLQEASVYAGVSDRTINKWRNEGALYALVQEGKSRGYRYPLWQFDADRQRLSKALRPFQEAKASPWVVHNFFQGPHSSLGGRTPREWVLDTDANIDQLVKVAQARFAGDQGAS